MTIDHARAAIHSNFPKFDVNTIQFIAEGFDNIAFEVNNDYIFRFTKSNLSSGFGGSLEVEECLLPKLGKHISVKIPNPTFYGQQSNGLPFIGYKKINGEELSLALLDTMSKDRVDKIFKTISTFFNDIHALPTSLATKCGVQITDFKKRYTQDSVDMKKSIFPLLSINDCKTVESWIEGYLNNSDNFSYMPSFLHADLWLSHVFVNASTYDIEGIIDFSDMTIGDPDYDYMQICRAYPKAYDYFEKYVSTFDRNVVKRKTEFFSRWNVVQDLMLFIQREDQEGIQETLLTLKELTRDLPKWH